MIENKAYNEEIVFSNSVKYLLISAAILFLLFYKNISVPVGYLFGGIAALVNFRLIIYSVRRIVDKRVVNSLTYNGLFVLRMVIIAFVIGAAIQLKSINLVSAVIGLLWVRTVIYAEAWYRYFKDKKVQPTQTAREDNPVRSDDSVRED